MSEWLQAITHVLDNTPQPIQVFFRDDDAGWANERLYSLLDVFAKAAMPIDLAIIPGASDQALADELLARKQQSACIGLHQHGYTHTNHELVGRKCEFGHHRSKTQQFDDLRQGQTILTDLLGNQLDPIFTPPWNRCTQDTADCLEDLDFQILSRDITAQPINTMQLKQIPVHIDWSRFLKTTDPLAELEVSIAKQLANTSLTGIMLHHADMTKTALKPLAQLLKLFADHPHIHGMLLRDSLS